MFEQIGNIYCIVVNVIGLTICLFHYVDRPRRSWIYVTAYLLCSLLSAYYWGAYSLLMGDTPTIDSFTAYFGENLSLIPLILLLIHVYRQVHKDVQKWFFNPLCLIPIPLNIYQCTIYNQFGGIFNNIWQCLLSSIIVVMSLNLILFHFKMRKTHRKVPYLAIVLFFFVFFEYGMWTSSCFEWPNEWLDPYNYFNLLAFFTGMIALPWSILKTHGEKIFGKGRESTKRLRKIFKPVYAVFVLICCVGGFMLAMWIRNVLESALGETEDFSAYAILDVLLFVFSAILVVFCIAVIFVVNYVHRASQADRLKEEREKAVRSNEAKSEFLANMSHEIRTPINAVMGMNEMILRESLKARDAMGEEQSELRETFSEICNYSGNIDNAGKNLLLIINDILDFSKIEAGKMEIMSGEYRLSSLLNDVSNMIYFRAKDKELNFVVEVDEDLPDVLNGDEAHIRQAVINILNNAVKYTNEGGVCLRVFGEQKKDEINGHWLQLTFEVQDTGIGIRKQDLEKLFAKFERVDLEQNKGVEGTGLGLAITRNLIEMMGGDVDVESLYGSGSTFTVHVPQMIVSTEPVGNFREKFEKSMEKTTAYKGSFEAPEARILIVDDTKVNLLVAKGLLKETKMRIDTASSGADAVRLANATSYDVIMMDQRMPKVDGSQALQMIREQRDGYNKTTPVICLTADAVMGAKERYIAEGFTDYLTKPIDSAAMEKMLIKYLPDEKVTLK